MILQMDLAKNIDVQMQCEYYLHWHLHTELYEIGALIIQVMVESK